MAIDMKHILQLAVTLLLLGAIAIAVAGLVANRRSEPVRQPIDFNHQLHAEENGISCLYCHTDAVRADAAGVPPVQTCYQCHRIVKEKSPEMEQLQQAFENNQPIEWLRIYSLPRHVRFSHQRHVRGGVDCQSCHGDVAAMERVTLESPLTMGWCLNCHEQRQAPIGCEICHK